MSMKRRMALRVSAFVLSCALGACGSEGDVKDCVNGAVTKYFAAKEAFHSGVRDLTVAGNPALEEAATAEMELEIAKGKARLGMLDYLLTHDATRIDRSNGIVRAVNYDWTDKDLTGLKAADPSFGALVTRIETLQAEHDSRPDGAALLDYFRDHVNGSADYQALTADLETGLKNADAALAQCGG